MDPGAKFSQPIPSAWNGFVYTIKGKGSFGEILYHSIYTHRVQRLVNIV